MFTNFANQSTTLYRSNKVTIPDSFCQSVLGGGFMPHLGHRPQFRKKKAGVHNSGKFILLKNRGFLLYKKGHSKNVPLYKMLCTLFPSTK